MLPEWVKRRAGGRRRYNAVRKLRATMRRVEVQKMYLHGMNQAAIARALGVHRSTICRDMQRIEAEARAQRVCPYCRRPYDWEAQQP